MYKPIRKADLIIGGTAVKQGEIFTLGFQLFDANGLVIVPTVGQTITVKVANKTGVVFETTAVVVSDHIEFTIDENIGAGKMRVELTVADGANVLQKYPANGYIELYITASLDDIGTGTIYTVTAAEMFARIEGSEEASASAVQTAGEAVVIAENAVETADAVRADFDLVVAEAGSSNPEVVLARGGEADLKTRLDKTSQQLAETATKTEVANALNGSPKGTYATLAALQAAYPTGTTGVFIVTADGHIYSWSGSAWVDRGLYQAVGIADNSVTRTKVSEDIQKTIGYANNILFNKEVINPYHVYAKPSTSNTRMFVELLFDMQGIAAVGGELFRFEFTYNTNDRNISTLGYDVFTNNDATPTINAGGTGYTTNENLAVVYDADVKINKTGGAYVSTNRYAHIFIACTPANVNILSKFFFSNAKFFVGNAEVTNLLAVTKHRMSPDSVLESKWYEPIPTAPNIGTDLKDLQDEFVEIDQTLIEHQEAISLLTDYGYVKPRHFKGKSSSGTYIYVHEYLIDLNTPVLTNSPYTVQFDYYTEDTNITQIGAEIFLNNSATPLTYSGGVNWQGAKITPVFNKVSSFKQIGGTYNSTYKYAHVFLALYVTDLLIDTEIYVGDFNLSIGNTAIPAGNLMSITRHKITAGSLLEEKFISKPNVITAAQFQDMEASISSFKNRFEGKIMNCLGDSITALSHGGSNKKYWQYLIESLGLTVREYGISSSTISNNPAGSYNSMALRYLDMIKHVDYR